MLSILGALLVGACGSYDSPAAPQPMPTPTPVPSVIHWRLRVMNVDQAAFGVAIRLDDEEVYRDATAVQSEHVVEFERPYAGPGAHDVEFEILQSSKRRSTYQAHVTAQVTPTGPMLAALGVPTVLKAGERLNIDVSL